MSVVSGELRRIAAGAARGMGGGSVKSRWMLVTDDTIAEIEAPGYFNAQADQLVVGDQIDVSANLSAEPEMRSYVVARKTGQAVEVRPQRGTSGYVFVDDYRRSTDVDDTAAFQRALAASPTVMGTAGKTYVLNELVPPSNARIDLGGAIVRPAVGARFAIGGEGQRNFVHLYNGFCTDPDGRTLRTTTTTASVSSGATVVPVVSTAGLAVGDALWIVTQATDGGGKAVLHYSRISALTSTTVTLREPVPAAGIANGASVMHTKGVIYLDGWTRSRVDLDAFNCPLVFTLTGKNYSVVGSSHHRVTIQSADAIWLQVGVIAPDVAQCNYEIDTAFGASDKPYRALCALSFDSQGEVTGTSGDHKIHTLRALNMTHAIIGRRFILSFMGNVVGDNLYGFAFDFDDGSDLWATQVWAAYNFGSISLRGNSRLVVVQLQAGQTAPWSGAHAIEVQDGSVLVLDPSQVTGSPTVRNEAGWAGTNTKYVIGQLRAESGTGGFPGYAFNGDLTTGISLNAPGVMGFSAGGTLAFLLAAAGIRSGWGSATAPWYAFNGDDNTGMYRVAADALGLAAGGVRSFYCDANSYWFHANGVMRGSGAGSPEGVVTAPPGSMWLRTNGGPGTTLYVKESGTGNTGWVAK